MKYLIKTILALAALIACQPVSTFASTLLESAKDNIDRGNYIKAFEELDNFIGNAETNEANDEELSQAYK